MISSSLKFPAENKIAKSAKKAKSKSKKRFCLSSFILFCHLLFGVQNRFIYFTVIRQLLDRFYSQIRKKLEAWPVEVATGVLRVKDSLHQSPHRERSEGESRIYSADIINFGASRAVFVENDRKGLERRLREPFAQLFLLQVLNQFRSLRRRAESNFSLFFLQHDSPALEASF